MDELRSQVQRLVESGVPDDEIGAFIRQYSSSVEAPKQAKQEEPSTLQSMGVGLRGAIKGIVDPVASLGAIPINAALAAMGSEARAGSTGDAWSDVIGLPRATHPAEVAAQRFNEGATSVIPAYLTGGLLRGAGPTSAAVGESLQASPGMQAAMGAASTSAAGAAEDAGGGALAQMGAGVAAPMVLGGALGLAPGTRVNMARADAFKRANEGVVPSLGVVSDGGFAPMVEAALAKYPVTAGAMQRSAEESRTALANAVANAAERVGGANYPKTQNELGQAIIDGVMRARKAASDAYGNAWNAKLEPYVNLDVPLTSTDAIYQEKALRRTPDAAFARAASQSPYQTGGDPSAMSAAAREALGGAERMLGGVWKDYKDLGAASLGAVKDKRTVLLENIEKGNVARNFDTTSAEALRVAGGLKDDMFSKLEQHAPDVADDLLKMDSSYAAWAKRAERLDKRMTGGGREPEAVAQKTGAKSLTIGDVIRLRDLLTPEEWGRIRGGIMNELPRSGQGEVSSASFATRTGNGTSAYRPEVKDAIFGNELNDARLIAEGMNRVGANINTSNTAANMNTMHALTGGGVGGALIAGQPATAAGLAATVYGLPWAASKFLTSPTVTRMATSPAYQNILQEALRARAPMVARGLLSGNE